MKRNKALRHCTGDKVSEDNILHTLRRSAKQRTERANIVQPPSWTESVNQLWLVKNTARKIMAKVRKNRIITKGVMEIKLKEKRKATNIFKSTAMRGQK